MAAEHAVAPPGATAITDYLGVIEALGRYFDGLYRGDVALLRTVFHPASHLATASEGALEQVDLDTWLQRVATRTAPAERDDPYAYRVESIVFAGPVTAQVRMHSTLLSRDFTDLLGLVRLGEEWRIITKLYHHAPADPAHGRGDR